MDLCTQGKHKRTSRLLHPWRSFQQTRFFKCYFGFQAIQLCCAAVGTDSEVSANVTEWNRPEKLHEHLGKSGSESPGRPAEHQINKRTPADSLYVALYPGPKCWQICSGWEHQYVGAQNGDDTSLAAAAEQHPNHSASL